MHIYKCDLQHLSKSGKFKVDIREWNSNVFDEFPGDDSTKVTFLILDTTDGDPHEAPKPWFQAAQLEDRHVSTMVYLLRQLGIG